MTRLGTVSSLSRSSARLSTPTVVAAAVIVVTTVVALLATNSPVLAVLAAAGGLMVIALAFSPDLATMAVVALIYSNAAVVAVKFHGVPGFVGGAAPFLLLIPLANTVLAERRPVILPSATPWLLGFLAAQAVSALLASDTQTAWGSIIQFLFEGMALFFILYNVVRTPQVLQRLMWVLLAVGAMFGLLSVHQTLTKNHDQSYSGFAQADTVEAQELMDQIGVVLAPDSRPPRQGGPFGEPNRYAQIMAALLPLGMLQLTKGRSVVARMGGLGASALIALAIAFTFSRGAAVGIAVSIIAALLLSYVRLREIAVLVAGFAMFVLVVPGYGTRLQSIASATSALTNNASGPINDGAIQGRLGEQVAALKVFADHPVVGVGPGLFAQYYQDYVKSSGFRIHVGPRQAHNLLLDIAAETGIFGLICFLGAVTVTIRDVTRARRRLLTADPELAVVVTSIGLGILAIWAQACFCSCPTFATSGCGLPSAPPPAR
jgi:putative inorganic carbon (HCO3(-)) transporter